MESIVVLAVCIAAWLIYLKLAKHSAILATPLAALVYIAMLFVAMRHLLFALVYGALYGRKADVGEYLREAVREARELLGMPKKP